MSSSMRTAVVTVANGPFDVVECACPTAAPGELLVRIHASGVNPLDTKIRAGSAAHAQHPCPAVLGLDMAGTVVAVGGGVVGFAVNDEVFGMIGGVGGLQGSLAQYAAVDARLVAHKPASLSMREAAALPLAVITAWEGLVDRAHVARGQRVLIQGGAGGVGHVAIQVALAHGAEVYATGSARNEAVIRQLGAVPIDYRTEDVADYVARYTGNEGFDLVYDTVGGATLDASFIAASRFGHVVSALGWGTHLLAPLSFKGGTYSGVFSLLPLLTGTGRDHHGKILRAAAALVEAGKLMPILDPRRFAFDTLAEAHDIVAGGRTRGKVVVDID
ncbi:zinc-dependent alcohol dehydrogenase family protein [Sphingobium sp. H33]|uniref:Zinc-dependent alcohol dehydrogenase family protein n=2 Tax=Sphingobium nicotianae TaxID=2782607 RepID=A0A9X1DE19_9SPHN|nr:zinc-dependent alcohol dehydrogenase family protein [Sphingobium nicotianae]